MAVNRIYIIAICTAAALAPLAIGVSLSSQRFGRFPGYAMGTKVPPNVSRIAPADWLRMTGYYEQRWIGVALRQYSPGSAPDCTESDVAIWHIKAGWPFACVEAHWLQDYRRNIYEDIVFSSCSICAIRPLTFGVYNVFSSGLGHPFSPEDPPPEVWIPIRPIPLGYVVNCLIYYFIIRAIGALIKFCCQYVNRNRIMKGLCQNCGYVMNGLPTRRCPECGATAAGRHGSTREL